MRVGARQACRASILLSLSRRRLRLTIHLRAGRQPGLAIRISDRLALDNETLRFLSPVSCTPTSPAQISRPPRRSQRRPGAHRAAADRDRLLKGRRFPYDSDRPTDTRLRISTHSSPFPAPRHDELGRKALASTPLLCHTVDSLVPPCLCLLGCLSFPFAVLLYMLACFLERDAGRLALALPSLPLVVAFFSLWSACLS